LKQKNSCCALAGKISNSVYGKVKKKERTCDFALLLHLKLLSVMLQKEEI
jgi:hypothetical protein